MKKIKAKGKQIIKKARVYENSKKQFVSDYHLDNEGSVYFIRPGEVVILDKNIDYEYWSQAIYFEEMPLGGFFNNLSIKLSKDNHLFVFGTYRGTDCYEDIKGKNSKLVKNGDTQVEGAFLMKIDGFSKEVEIAKVTYFDQSFIDQFKTERDIKRKKELELDKLGGETRYFPKSDGGMVVIMETGHGGGIGIHNVIGTIWYYYSDLVVFNFNAEGEMVWTKRVPKKQRNFIVLSILPPFVFYTPNGIRTPLSSFSEELNFSYIAGLSDDRIYLVYNDHRKNKSRIRDFDKLKSMGTIRKSVPTVVAIDLETGAKTKRSDYGFASGDAKIQYTLARQKEQGDTLIIFASKKKKYKYGFVNLNADRMKSPTLEAEQEIMDDYLANEKKKEEKENKGKKGNTGTKP